MARKDQYIISKSNFVLRHRNATTSKGAVYEDDQLTLVPDDGLYDEGRAIYSDSNFKFRIRTDLNEKKRHFGGKWVKNGDDGEVWTLGDCSSTTTTSETKIVLKPNYSSLSDFAYYGSATELIKASVRDILLRYPAGICYMGNYKDNKIKIGGEYYYIVYNGFEIDIWTKGVSEDSVENPLRVLSASYKKYLYGTSNTFVSNITITPYNNITCPNSIIAKTTIQGGDNSSVVLYTYLTDKGEHVILCETTGEKGAPIIRLPQNEVDRIYDELDDFEKVLLDRTTTPYFRATLETPYFDGQGYYVSYSDYTWPSYSHKESGFLLPDLTSPSYSIYLNHLLDVAEFLDEYDTGNLWRMLTHPSIKNLDWTFKRENGDETDDLSDFDTTRMKGALELYGRQFDDLKRYADNIKATNTITYDEKNNIPDYFITDAVENDGWEAYNIGPSKDNSLLASGHSSSDANTSFLRHLSINSNYIQSLKGTRRGLEVIMGLFGMKKGEDYTITEYAAIADRFPDRDNFDCVLPHCEGYYYGDDIYHSWPVAVVTETSDSGERSYMIPWFDKHGNYDSGLYFQQNGGWESAKDKEIDTPISSIKTLTDNNYIDIYGETLQYMRFAKTVSELTAMTTTKLYDNIVCYVEDISEVIGEGAYQASDDDRQKLDDGATLSHYFILKNVALSPFVGYVDDALYKCYGWRNVFANEFDGNGNITEDGARVLYMESLKTVEDGNNPHIGYGNYDMGKDYLDHFRNIFKYEEENGRIYDLDEDLREYMTFGDCEEKTFSAKTMSFKNTDATPMVCSPVNNEEWNNYDYSKLALPDAGGDKSDTAATFSIINTKRITIEFNNRNSSAYKDYIENVVLKYVEQMMPSTAIFEYKFKNTTYAATPMFYEREIAHGLYTAEAHGVYINGDEGNNYMMEDGVEIIPLNND